MKEVDVLLIEDDNLLSAELRRRIELDGLSVYVAKSGVAALEYLEVAKPGVMLLDLILPQMNGFQFMEQVKTRPEIFRAPIIVISNLDQEDDIKRALDLGAKEYFVKAGTSIEALIKRVRAILKERK